MSDGVVGAGADAAPEFDMEVSLQRQSRPEGDGGR